jgi:hypothetical protein
VRLRYTAGAIDTVGGVDDGPTRTDSSELEFHTIDHRDARYDDLLRALAGRLAPAVFGAVRAEEPPPIRNVTDVTSYFAELIDRAAS